MATEAKTARWFCACDKQKLGPFTWEQLRERIAHQELKPQDMVLQEGQTRWQPAQLLDGLFTPETLPPALTVTIAPAEQAPGAETLSESRVVHATSPPGMPLVAGYEVLGELGRGGMGVVYKARQKGLNRLVALKMILTGSHAGAEEVARFRAEAEAVAKLRHPNIVQVYEIAEWVPESSSTPLPFFSLEFVDGGGLDRFLGGTPQPAQESARLVETLARAMHTAHEAGIIHRDLKPANVLLASGVSNDPGSSSPGSLLTPLANHVPKITDFGLAKQVETQGQTVSGAIMGTPSYMAPEQARGETKNVGPVADVWALGAILYECLTGRPPFKAAHLVYTLEQVLHQEPVPPSRLAPRVPRDLETICLKCLQKDQRKRYASARELADDLQRFLAGEPIKARPIGTMGRLVKWARRKPMVASLTLLLLAVFFTGFGLVTAMLVRALDAEATASDNAEQYRDERDQKDEALEQKGIALTTAENAVKARGVALEQEKRAREKEADNLYVAHMNLAQQHFERADILLARSFLERHVPKTPADKDRRGFEWHYYNYLCNSALHTLTLPGPVRAIAFSPVGSTLAIVAEDSKQLGKGVVFLWDSEKRGDPVLLAREDQWVLSLAWSPDGQTLAWGTGYYEKAGTIRLWDVTAGRERARLTTHKHSIVSLAFTPDGNTLASAALLLKLVQAGDVQDFSGLTFYSNEGQYNRPGEVKLWDPRSGKELAPLQGAIAGPLSLAVLSDNQTLIVGSSSGLVRGWDLDSRKPLFLISQGGMPIWTVKALPEGVRYVSGAGSWSQQGKHEMVHVMGDGGKKGAPFDVRSSASIQKHQGGILACACSSDGWQLATASFDRTVRLWKNSGENEAGALRGHTAPVQAVAFSPDGATLATGSWDGTVKL